MVYLKSVENVITLGKLIGLLFLFCLPLLSILFLKTKRNDLARPVMGTIFLVTIEVSLLASRSSLVVYARLGLAFLTSPSQGILSNSQGESLAMGKKKGK